MLFAGMMFCFAALEIFGPSPKAILMRQVGFTLYVLIILITRGFGVKNTTRRERCYLLFAVIVTAAIFATTAILGYARVIDYFGPVSFLAGIYVFVIVIPQCWRERADYIIIPSVSLVIISVCSSLYIGSGDVVERGNALAAYAGLGILMFLGISLRSGLSFLKRFFCWSSVVLLIVVMAAALGRTSIVACAGSFLFVAYIGSTTRRRLLITGLIILIMVVLSPYWSVLLEQVISKGGSTSRSEMGLESRIIVWKAGLSQTKHILWLGKGRFWIFDVTGLAAHSSYLGIYFEYGIFAAISWMIMCAMGFWAAIKTLLLYKGTNRYPLAPFCVIYFLILGLAESYFDVMIGGFGALFYVCSGLCLFEVNKAKQYQQMEWMKDYESMQDQPIHPLTVSK
jgi:O-antigen ligase